MTLCGSCGEEIRFGHRHGQGGWWHREDVDHNAVLGQPYTAAMAAEVERQLDLPRVRTETKDDVAVEVTYTTREFDRARMKKAKRDELDEEDDIAPDELPPVEIPCHPITVDDLAPRSGIRQVANLILKQGWDLRRLTRARGPYVGAKGHALSISDSIVLSAIEVEVLDGKPRWAVGSWRDGKFDFAYVGVGARSRRVNATELKEWIKGTYEPPTTDSDD